MVPREPKYKDRLYINIQYKRFLHFRDIVVPRKPKYEDRSYINIQHKLSLFGTKRYHWSDTYKDRLYINIESKR